MPTSACTTCGRRCGSGSRPRRASRSARATTNASSTKDADASANGKRSTSNDTQRLNQGNRRVDMTQKVLLLRQRAWLVAMMAIALVGGLALFAQRATTPEPQTAVNHAFNQFKTLNEG